MNLSVQLNIDHLKDDWDEGFSFLITSAAQTVSHELTFDAKISDYAVLSDFVKVITLTIKGSIKCVTLT